MDSRLRELEIYDFDADVPVPEGAAVYGVCFDEVPSFIVIRQYHASLGIEMIDAER